MTDTRPLAERVREHACCDLVREAVDEIERLAQENGRLDQAWLAEDERRSAAEARAQVAETALAAERERTARLIAVLQHIAGEDEVGVKFDAGYCHRHAWEALRDDEAALAGAAAPCTEYKWVTQATLAMDGTWVVEYNLEAEDTIPPRYVHCETPGCTATGAAAIAAEPAP